jgi:glycoprotein 6-alpha-L-fucosyltransferase
MNKVEDIYQKKIISGEFDTNVVRRVFLASDDPLVLSQLKSTYPKYVFLSNNKVSKLAEGSLRYTEDSLYGTIADVVHLSNTNFLVCTFSSQVCRMGFELMQMKHVDASSYYYSLDDPYYFGGQLRTTFCAKQNYQARNTKEMDLKVGDVIEKDGFIDKEGYVMGIKNGVHGIFPIYLTDHCMSTTFPDLLNK